MVKFIILTFFILFSTVVAGQDVIDIEADYIEMDSDQLRYYTKIDSNTFRVSYYGFDDYQELSIIKKDWTKSVVEIDSLVKIKKLVSVDEIKNMNLKAFQEEVAERSFYYKSYDDTGLFRNLDQGLFGEAEIKNDFENKDNLFICGFYRIAPIRINNTKILYQFIGLKNQTLYHYLIPLKDGFNISGHLENKESHNKELLDKWNEQWFSKSSIEDMYSLGEHYIYDYSETQKLVAKKHDSISSDFFGDNIIGYKDRKVVIYNVFLKDISPENIRSVNSYNNNCLQVLVGNKVKFINSQGELFNEPLKNDFFHCGMLYYNSEIKKIKDSYQLEYHTEVTTSEKDSIFGFPISKDVRLKTLIDNSYIKGEVKFVNSSDSQRSFFFSDKFVVATNFLLSKNEKGQPVLTPFKVTRDFKDDIHEINHQLIIQYDQQITYDKLNYDIDSKNTILTLNGLKSYLGINKKPKYKTLEKFQGSFARFELLNGRKGWLQKDGIEFLDQ